MTASFRILNSSALLAVALVSSLGCNSVTGASDLSIGTGGSGGEGAASSGEGGATAAATTGGSTAAATSSGAGGTSGASTGAAGSTSATTGGGGPDAAQICVDDINAFRATLNLPPYARWTPEETCAADEAAKDAAANKAHSAFGQCGESAQDECPGWQGPPESMIGNCLKMMWDEGPGDFNQGHGHFINMSSKQYTKVACGFHLLPDGHVWATQDFK